jgi:hypothetical protein
VGQRSSLIVPWKSSNGGGLRFQREFRLSLPGRWHVSGVARVQETKAREAWLWAEFFSGGK